MSATVLLPLDAVSDDFASEFSLKYSAQKHIENEGVHTALPRIAESGNSVPMAVLVNSPMREASYVKTVHISVQEILTPKSQIIALCHRVAKLRL